MSGAIDLSPVRQDRVTFWGTPRAVLTGLFRHRFLIAQLARREVSGRYRGSFLGGLWMFLEPLLRLAIYSFVFGTVLRVRWSGPEGSALGPEAGQLGFAIFLFSGLIVHGLLAQCLSAAPRLITSNPNYVKRVVFPLEVLSYVSTSSALFQAAMSMAVLLVFQLAVTGALEPTALLLPVVWLPFVVLLTGLGWFLSALGVYLRDIGQMIGLAVTAMLFLGPIFFPLSVFPEGLRAIVYLNPITVIVNETRAVLLWGNLPDWGDLSLYALSAVAVAWLGHYWFSRVRRGFADVI